MTDIYNAFARADMQRNFRWLTLALAVTALSLNLTVSWRVFASEPLREAASRSLMAANSSFFFDSGLAEPVPVAALKVAMVTGLNPEKLLRAEGLAVYAVLFALTLFVLRRRFGEVAASMAALFLAANPTMGFYAMQGSSHLYALVFLLLFWHYFDEPEGGRRGALLAGLAGGLACLSRLDSAWALLAIAGLTWAVRRREFALKEAALSLGLAAMLTLPYLAWQKAQYGAVFYAQELSLRRWANVDRYGYGPQAEAPRGPLAPAAFLLRNGAAGAVKDGFSGLGRALGFELPRALYYKSLAVLVFLGVYAAFLFKKDRLLFFLAAGLLPALPLAAITQVPAAGGIELRYYLWPLWGLCALAGLGFQETLVWVEAGVDKWAARKAEQLKRLAGRK